MTDEDIHDLVLQLETLGYHCENGVSEEAFLELMRNYLLRDQQEVVWTAIRSMKYVLFNIVIFQFYRRIGLYCHV